MTVCVNLQNICLSLNWKGCFPDDLKNARVTPIYKREDSSDVIYYRAISVLPRFCKILERIMHNHFYKYTLFLQATQAAQSWNWQKINQKLSNKHPEAKPSLFENYSLSSFTLSSKNNKWYSKKGTKNKCIRYMINDNENEAEDEK